MQENSRRGLTNRRSSVLDLPEVKNELEKTFKDRKWRILFANSKLALTTDRDETSSFLTSLLPFSVKYCMICETPWGTLDIAKARTKRDAENKMEQCILSWGRIVPEHIEALENMNNGPKVFELIANQHLAEIVSDQKTFDKGIEELANALTQYRDYAEKMGIEIFAGDLVDELMKLPSTALPKLSRTASILLADHSPSDEVASVFQKTQLQELVKKQAFDHADLPLFISKADTILRDLIAYSETAIPKMGVNPTIICSVLDDLWKVRADVSTWRYAMLEAGRNYRLSPVFWHTTRNWLLSKVGRQLRRLLRDSFSGLCWVIVGSEEIEDPRYHAGAQARLIGHEIPQDKTIEESDENTFPTLAIGDGKGFWRFLPDKLSHGDVEHPYSEIGYETGEVRLSTEEFDAEPSSVAVGTIWKIAEVRQNGGRRRIDKVQVSVYSYFKCIIRHTKTQEVLLYCLFETLEQCQSFVSYLDKMLAETFSIPEFDSVNTGSPRKTPDRSKKPSDESSTENNFEVLRAEAQEIQDDSFELLLQLPADVNAVRFSPQGDILIIATADNSLCAYEMETGRMRYTLKGFPALGFSIAVSPDGKYIASGSWDNSVKFLDLETGRHVRSLEGHTNYVSAVAFSSDGDILASGSWDGTIKVWKLPSGRLLNTIKAHEDWVKQIVISQRTGRIVSASRDRTIRVWSLGSGKLMKSINTGSNYTSTMALGPSEKLLATGSMDRIVRIWDLKSGELIEELKGHSGGISALAFGIDSNVVLSASLDQSVRVWDVQEKETTEVMSAKRGAVLSLSVNPGESSVAIGYRSGSVGIWRECPLGSLEPYSDERNEDGFEDPVVDTMTEEREKTTSDPVDELWDKISTLPESSRDLVFKVLKYNPSEEIPLHALEASRLDVIRIAPKLSLGGDPLFELSDSSSGMIVWGRHLSEEITESLQNMIPAAYRGVDEG